MRNLRTILERKNERAAEEQTDAREIGPRGYRDPVMRPVILANRINMRRYLRGNRTDPLLTPVVTGPRQTRES